jgi:1-acyl-sn-glycerol-3-phosphate acyltransferase
MFDTYRQRDPGKALPWIAGYAVVRWMACMFYSLFFRARSFGAHNIVGTGPVLIVSNHQSYLDPPLISTAFRPRHTHFVARSSLFRFKPFGWMIAFLNSIPIREESGDSAAIREILKRLDGGYPVLMFPEGNRSEDGAMEPFKRGAALLVKRSNCPVQPTAVEGCFDGWARSKPFPRFWGCPTYVMFGRPIPHDELMKDGADAALRRLEREIDAMRLELRKKIRRHTRGAYPAPGAGDGPFVGPARAQ